MISKWQRGAHVIDPDIIGGRIASNKKDEILRSLSLPQNDKQTSFRAKPALSMLKGE